ncbi:hypothetical protein LUZ60_000464 [Juncus effusus]|nr:hypothetical protein LUZ60_000464 [Juncus effusus]
MSTWEEITTTSVVTSEENFEMPSIVLQTAVTGSTSSDDISFNWVEADPSATYFMVLHMTEIEDLAATSLREFDVIVNEESLFPDHFIPLKFQSGWAYFTRHGYSSYDWSLVPTKNSTLPPILNAFEILMILPVILTPSYSGDDTNVNIPRNYIANVQTPDVPFPIRNAPKGEDGLHIFESRQFDYKELKMITNNFQNNIGTGGFGSVYVGRLENETQVAVKMRSHSSSQGVKEFLAEAKNLTRVHHKHLVSLMGYCMDGDCMALVYEYMQEGTLQGKLRDDARPLTWKQRLKIGYESAQGLDYLHNSCNPPLIHRDVKTSNILLNSNLEAKIADFGLSRAFGNDVTSHVSTAVVGTPGYLDPEYYQSYQLSKKSDVFSFGVVLLEIVTGQPPVIGGPEGGHISDWVKQRLSKGDIERIVDSRMRGQYDINSVWKVTTLAEKCTERSSLQRPTMNMVVADLKESLQLEISTEGNRTTSTPFMSQYTNQYNYSRNDNLVSDVSQNSGFEMAYMHGVKGSGPSAR